MMRCPWCEKDDLYRDYHDREWGVPVTDDTILFEFLVLETAQAGLSWHTILKRREGYRNAFARFDPEKVARFTPSRAEKLMQDVRIIRNRAKIASTIVNAQVFLRLQSEFGSFSKYQWRFVDGQPIRNRWKTITEVPAMSTISDTFSRDLKERGMRFVGSTVIYAHMQATGMVNDHLLDCFRYQKLHS
jgi:DNA-3-methyladenine glycosylase I